MKPDYYLRVGQYELDFDALPMAQFSTFDERGCLHTVPRFTGVFLMTRDTSRVHAGDRVEFFIRRKKGKAWGPAVFSGDVLLREPRVDVRNGEQVPMVRVVARGHLGRLDDIQVSGEKYEGTLDEMLNQWMGRHVWDLVDDVDIDVTQPDIFPDVIEVEEGTAWTFLAEVRRYCAIDVSIVTTGAPGLGRQLTGTGRVLKISDERTPDLVRDDVVKVDKVDLDEPAEELLATHPHIVPPSWMDQKTGGEYARRVMASLTALRTNGRAIIRNFDPDPGNPLRNPNQLVRFPGVSSKKVLAVQGVKIYRDGPAVTARLTYSSRVMPYWVPHLMPGGCNARASPVGQRTHGVMGRLRGMGRQG